MKDTYQRHWAMKLFTLTTTLSRILWLDSFDSTGTGFFFYVIYILVHVYGANWVACEVYLDRKEIYVYDSTFDVHFDYEIDTVLHPLCYLLPYLLDQASFYDYRIDIDDQLRVFSVRP